MEYGKRFTLAPKSNSAFSTLMPPILTEIVGHPESLYFTGVLNSMIALTCSVKKAFFFFTLRPFFTVHKEFCIGGDLFDHVKERNVNFHLS